MLSVTKLFTFEAAHDLPNYKGACHNCHGHSYLLQISVEGETQTEGECKGMIIDFSKIKEVVNEQIIKKYDHKYLNNFFVNPTAENMVMHFVTALFPALPGLCKIRLYETATSYCEWKR